MWHHDVTNAHTYQCFRPLFDPLPVRMATSDHRIRAFDFGAQFSFNLSKSSTLLRTLRLTGHVIAKIAPKGKLSKWSNTDLIKSNCSRKYEREKSNG